MPALNTPINYRSEVEVGFDVLHIRHDFPLLDKTVYERPLIYFDNAATTQKPRQVIDRVTSYYKNENCNIHRGVHFLSQHATESYETARRNIQAYINAQHQHEIIFTKGATEAINLVAFSFGKTFIEEGDEIIISAMEHHSNLVPWQMVAQERGAVLRVIPVDDSGELDMMAFKNMLNERTRIIAVTHLSNVLGTINPVKRIVEMAHNMDIPVLVDGAQAIPHQTVDVQEIGCDFYCFSGHKMYGPMGIGVLYGRDKYLRKMPPYQGGGEMISEVTFEKTTYNDLPYKFEAGTPNVVGVLGLDAAIKYLNEIGIRNIYAYEKFLLDYITVEFLNIPWIKIYGTSEMKSSVLSFNIDKVHPYDAGTLLDKMGIAIRTGHHCAQPLMERYGIPGAIRASFAFYNTRDELDKFIDAIRQVKRMLG